MSLRQNRREIATEEEVAMEKDRYYPRRTKILLQKKIYITTEEEIVTEEEVRDCNRTKKIATEEEIVTEEERDCE